MNFKSTMKSLRNFQFDRAVLQGLPTWYLRGFKTTTRRLDRLLLPQKTLCNCIGNQRSSISHFLSEYSRICGANVIRVSRPSCCNYTQKRNRVSHLESEYRCDCAIIGGGAIGSSIAYHLKTMKGGDKIDVMVFERDLNYTRSSTVLSVGSVRQQFSIGENIKLSKYGFDFMKDAKEKLTVFNEDPVDICFKESGYLFLASPEGMDILHQNTSLQLKNGAQVKLYDSKSLSSLFPWMNATDLVGGSLGTANEGWFDPWSFLSALRKKNQSLGVQYVQANILAFPEIVEDDGFLRVVSASIGDPAYPSPTPISTIYATDFINATGAWSGQLSRLLGIGVSKNDPISDHLGSYWRQNPLLRAALPIVPRKRYVYVFHCPDGPGPDCPMVVDPSGVYFRSEGPAGYYICGRSPPTEAEEPETVNLEVDYDFFDEKIWPILAKRVPAFEKLKVTNAWAGYYDYNFLDQNGVVGFHPAFQNFFIAAGFSGHGIQMSPGIGKAASEILVNESERLFDLKRFSFERFYTGDLIFEKNIV